MRLRSFALLGSLCAALALSAGCGDALDKLLGKDSPTPTPGSSGTPTPTGSGTPTPLPSPSVSTAGEITTFDWGTVSLPAGTSPNFKFTAPANAIGVELLAIGGSADEDKFFLFFSVTTPTGTVINSQANGPEQQ